MALDRFIAWTARKRGRVVRPTRDEIVHVVTNTLGGMAGSELVLWGEQGENRLFVKLPGKNTHPLRGIKGVHESANREPDPERAERWIEIYDDPHTTDVMTREADAFTNAVAQLLQETLARFWSGTKDPHGI